LLLGLISVKLTDRHIFTRRIYRRNEFFWPHWPDSARNNESAQK
jgi:hypothetical protein